MINLKKYILLAICLIATFWIFLDSIGNNAGDVDNGREFVSEKKNRISFQGKGDDVESLDDLKELSHVIVRAVKTQELGVEIAHDLFGDVQAGYTKSEFKVEEIVKNELDFALDVIIVGKSNFYDEVTDTIYDINGYEKMKTGKEYLLFLVDGEDGVFLPKNVVYGKVPLSTEDLEVPLENEEDDVKEVEAILLEARNDYEKHSNYKNKKRKNK